MITRKDKGEMAKVIEEVGIIIIMMGKEDKSITIKVKKIQKSTTNIKMIQIINSTNIKINKCKKKMKTKNQRKALLR
jgi:hypothetical protein